MKQLLLLACLSLFTLGLNAQVFVDIDATGSADGTSWANAYTNLNDALLAAPAGSEVWIAEGKYITVDTASFFIDKELTVLGGFVGSETMASEADPSKNETILSGDVMQNDVQGVYDSISRADNNRVLFITDTNLVSTFTVTIDGITIQDGSIINAAIDAAQRVAFTGGGMLTFAKVDVSRVTFKANFSRFGSAIGSYFETANGSTYDDISVENNYAGIANMIWVENTDSVTFSNSKFLGGEAPQESGMAFFQNMRGFEFANCVFDSISTPVDRGSAIAFSGVLGANVHDCTFTNLSADLGGAIYFRNSADFEADREIDADEVIIDNCTFDNISTDRWGGVIFFGDVSHRISNSSFSNFSGNASGGLGGAVYAQDNDDSVFHAYDINNTTFTNGSGNVGGSIFYFSGGHDISMTDVSIDESVSAGSGGGIYLNGDDITDDVATFKNLSITNTTSGGFGGGLIVLGHGFMGDSLTFTDNETALASGNGGGIYVQGSAPYTVSLTNSTFEGNRGLSGSGMASWGVSQDVTLANVVFDGNGSTTEGAFRGGGYAALHGSGSTVSLDNVDFMNNSVTQESGIVSGGGAIYLNSLDGAPGVVSVTNSRIEANTAADDADGGALYTIDGVDGVFDNVDFFSNSASDGGAIATFLFVEFDTVAGVPLYTYPDYKLDVMNSIFVTNIAGSQGGAISTQRTGVNLINTVFANNEVGTDGASGGAMIINGNSPVTDAEGTYEYAAKADITSTIVHSSFYNNRNGGGEGDVGSHIAIFQPQNPFSDTSVSVALTMQNNVFFNDDEDAESLAFEPATAESATAFGDITITSLGGNFFNTENGPEATAALGSNAADVMLPSDTDPEALFVDPNEDNTDFPDLTPVLLGDFGADNPLINAGTTGDLVPATGLNGNPRADFPDIGAFELELGLTNVETVEESGLDMAFFPNPTVNFVNIQNNDPAISQYTVLLTDNAGRVLRVERFNEATSRLNLTNVPTGVYNLQLLINGKQYSKQIVKQ
ncbi:T9SS type A sorting domain-containing protein [Neolewinella agarilytica]|uniref:Por secretion system C-terminal sorting domain-containing protein n=1 Tax=Neolewinella agarilytica TaxID=478744 RepID=A0A1H9AFL7_9BACT|nr:T9SS type A sorting domain-containing protein [Neolewinella agarilytica]SEP75490.1 Por secretion system C-terminal sorting domain-containing protein [Neolewinella agarilytica]